MSVISNLDLLNDRNKDDHYIDTEIAKFEEKFPGAKIIKPGYDREIDLDRDWAAYCSMSYSIKVLSNERSLRLFKMKNEEHYYQLKSKFLKMDIDNKTLTNVYTPISESAEEIEHKNDMADKYMMDSGYSLVKANYNDLGELNRDYMAFMNQCIDYQKKANDMSLSIYGKKVPELYDNEIKRFLVDDIKNKEMDGDVKEVRFDSPTIANEVSTTILESVMHSDDIVEKLMFSEINKLELGNKAPLVDSAVQEQIEELCRQSIYPDSYKPIGENKQFLLPKEVEAICDKFGINNVLNTKPFFNLVARCIGLKPDPSFYNDEIKELGNGGNDDEEKALSYGWLPGMPFDGDMAHHGAMRVNMIIKRCMIHKIIDISKTNVEWDPEAKPPKGLGIIILHDMEDDPDSPNKPKVFITADIESTTWKALSYGTASRTVNMDDVIMRQTKYPHVTAFFVPMDEKQFNEIDTDFKGLGNLKYVYDNLNMQYPEIADKKLFVTTLLNSIFSPKESKDDHLSIKCVSTMCFITYDEAKKNMCYNDIYKSFYKIKVFNENEELLESAAVNSGYKYHTEHSKLLEGCESLSPKDACKFKSFKSLFQ